MKNSAIDNVETKITYAGDLIVKNKDKIEAYAEQEVLLLFFLHHSSLVSHIDIQCYNEATLVP